MHYDVPHKDFDRNKPKPHFRQLLIDTLDISHPASYTINELRELL